MQLPVEKFPSDDLVSVEPPGTNPHPKYHTQDAWLQPAIVASVGGKVHIPNLSDDPIILHQNDHFCWVRYAESHAVDSSPQPDIRPSPPPPPPSPSGHACEDNNAYLSISVDPEGLLLETLRHKFIDVNKTYNSVFRHDIKVYNGAVGPLEAVVNMGPVQPPQSKRSPSLVQPKAVGWTSREVWWTVMNFKYCVAQRM